MAPDKNSDQTRTPADPSSMDQHFVSANSAQAGQNIAQSSSNSMSSPTFGTSSADTAASSQPAPIFSQDNLATPEAMPNQSLQSSGDRARLSRLFGGRHSRNNPDSSASSLPLSPYRHEELLSLNQNPNNPVTPKLNKAKSRKKLIIGIIVAIVILLVAAAVLTVFLVVRSENSPLSKFENFYSYLSFGSQESENTGTASLYALSIISEFPPYEGSSMQTQDNYALELSDRYDSFRKSVSEDTRFNSDAEVVSLLNKSDSAINLLIKYIAPQLYLEELKAAYRDSGPEGVGTYISESFQLTTDDSFLLNLSSLEQNYYSWAIQEFILFDTAGCIIDDSYDTTCSAQYYNDNFDINIAQSQQTSAYFAMTGQSVRNNFADCLRTLSIELQNILREKS